MVTPFKTGTAERGANESPVVSFTRGASPSRTATSIRPDSATLLVGEVADGFMLAFRSLARSARLPYASLRCRVEGTGDLSGPTAAFAQVRMTASVVVTKPSFEAEAFRLLKRAKTLAAAAKADAILVCDLEVLVQESAAARSPQFPLALTRQAG